PRIARTAPAETGSVGMLKFGQTHEPAGTYAHAVKHIYHPVTGQLWKVQECVANAQNNGCDGTKGQVYWQAQAVDVNGAITDVALGNGHVTHRTFNPVTGELTGIDTLDGALAVQDLAYQW